MFSRFLLNSLIVLAFIAVAAGSIWEAFRPAPQNVILLTVESWRRDQATPKILPNLFRAAQEGNVFTQHHATSAWTGTNTVSLLTGLAARNHPVHSAHSRIPPQWNMPLEHLANSGYAVSGHQGFMRIGLYDGTGLTPNPGLNPYFVLAQYLKSETPFFLWHHYLSTHLPYAPKGTKLSPELQQKLAQLNKADKAKISDVRFHAAIPAGVHEFSRKDQPILGALHAASLMEFDTWFADFWDFFNRSGLRENTMLIITADHGDEHGERGMVGHASTTGQGHLHKEIVELPLFIWLPNGEKMPTSGLSSHEDIIPTVFDWLDVPWQDFDGISLLSGAQRNHIDYLTSKAGFKTPSPEDIKTVYLGELRDGYKTIATAQNGKIVETIRYNYRNDPRELNPQALPLISEESLRLTAQLKTFQETLQASKEQVELFSAQKPLWIQPTDQQAITHKDVAQQAFLKWDGVDEQIYTIHYIAGEEPFKLEGKIDAQGSQFALDGIDEAYWKRFVLPYNKVKLRVTPKGSEFHSDWITVYLQ